MCHTYLRVPHLPGLFHRLGEERDPPIFKTNLFSQLALFSPSHLSYSPALPMIVLPAHFLFPLLAFHWTTLKFSPWRLYFPNVMLTRSLPLLTHSRVFFDVLCDPHAAPLKLEPAGFSDF